MAQRKSATRSRRRGKSPLSSTRRGTASRTSRASIGFPSGRNKSEAYESKRRRIGNY